MSRLKRCFYDTFCMPVTVLFMISTVKLYEYVNANVVLHYTVSWTYNDKLYSPRMVVTTKYTVKKT